MAPLTYPDIRYPSELDFYLVGLTQRFESPLTGAVQTSELPGAYWEAILTYRNLTDAQSRELLGFLDKLAGLSGRFYLWNMAQETPLGIATGTPKVKGADQTGKSLDTDGWTASQTGILLSGDLFAVNGELKRVTADCDSNADGDSTVAFTPALRASPGDNANITVTKPTCTMMLMDDRQAIPKFRPKPFADIVIQCREMWS